QGTRQRLGRVPDRVACVPRADRLLPRHGTDADGIAASVEVLHLVPALPIHRRERPEALRDPRATPARIGQSDAGPAGRVRAAELLQAMPRPGFVPILKVMHEDWNRWLEQWPGGALGLVEADRARDRRPAPVEALERMLPVPGRAVRHPELLAEGLEVERVKARHVLRLTVREVNENPSTRAPEAQVQAGEVFPQRRPARAVVELVRVEPEPPD